MGTETAAIGFQRPVSMQHCSDALTIQAVPVSASGTAATDNTATAAKRAGGWATTELGRALGKSPINEPSAPRASTPPDARHWEKRSLSSGSGRRHAWDSRPTGRYRNLGFFVWVLPPYTTASMYALLVSYSSSLSWAMQTCTNTTFHARGQLP